MKKYILSTIFTIAAVQLTMAQSITASGTVKNEKGEAVSSALIQEADTKTVTYTDSTGFFTLPLKSSSPILVIAKGYKDEKVSPKENLVVVLKPGKSSAKALTLGDPDKISGTGNTLNQINGFSFYNVSVAGGGTLYNISHKEDTKGSRYLVDSWAKGYVVDAKGNVVKNDNFSYNYDKINGSLLLTQDKRAAVDVDRDKIKSFTVYDALDQPQTYELVTEINPTHYTQVLASGDKYRVYKFTKTTFEKSDFKSDGMTSSGNKYDEYVDEPTYYVFNVKTASLQKITLKSKAIKQAFAADADKVKLFYSEHTDDEINESFLKDLAESLN
ncbi:carboxypeptidase-like regulatory domain-containing protein [Mucilaginibacter sp. FT3.2]|uniref:carboxypeptidase-like regulatory domain-containing protein n=1 Tax=Mucilaginibacter sp. FT3.2 TaxID=2723090 RepID=UPI001620FAA8|nr:carboxypeptidase-like regulatory domain-containing protein [Mucilaginibacter sp. FT3.2]MBB6230829.1 hypothetical protein [Mucilaginibacter sp. FT3.2]